MTEQIFLVHRNRDDFFNVILSAKDRETAKKKAHYILGGDADLYVVTPITEHGSRTVILLGNR